MFDGGWTEVLQSTLAHFLIKMVHHNHTAVNFLFNIIISLRSSPLISPVVNLSFYWVSRTLIFPHLPYYRYIRVCVSYFCNLKMYVYYFKCKPTVTNLISGHKSLCGSLQMHFIISIHDFPLPSKF
jgi:hypothetical protein